LPTTTINVPSSLDSRVTLIVNIKNRLPMLFLSGTFLNEREFALRRCQETFFVVVVLVYVTLSFTDRSGDSLRSLV
jgi:hypothetical protein